MKIRKAVLSDARVLADFNIKLALETEHLRLEPKVALAGVRALLRDSTKGIYFVAETPDAGVVGQLLITYEWSDWRNANIWWIQSVYVRSDFRGRGVFKSLFEHLTKLARKSKQVWSLRLYVEKQNESAKRTYVKLGMKEMYYDVFEIPISKKSHGGD
jgi:GNAT superfamily N-acetyltransferase